MVAGVRTRVSTLFVQDNYLNLLRLTGSIAELQLLNERGGLRQARR
jgi:hypothetical protein